MDTGHLGFVHSTCFDETGRYLYSSSIEGSVHVWDVERRVLERRFELHDGPINEVVCANGFIATAGFDGRATLSRADGRLVQSYAARGPVHTVALIGERLIFAGADGSIYVGEGETCYEMGSHAGAVECLAIDGGTLLAGSRDGVVAVWDLATRRRTANLVGHQDWVTRVAVVSAGRALTVGEDGLVILWELERGSENWRLDLDAPIWGLAMHGQTAFVGKAGAPVALDVETRAVRDIDRLDAFAARAISVSPNGLVALGHDAGGIAFMDAERSEPSWRIAGAYAGVLTAAFTDAVCVTGHQDGAITFIGGANSDGEEVLRVDDAHEVMAYASAVVSDQCIAVAGFDGRVTAWDSATRRCVADLEHGGEVFALSAGDGLLLSAGFDRWVLWSTDDWREVARENDIGTGIHTLAAMSVDGHQVVAVGEHGRMLHWVDGELSREVELPYQDSSAIAISPDASVAYIAFNDGVVGRVHLVTSEYTELHRLHDSWIRQLIPSADGQSLLSCSQNGIAVGFDVARGVAQRLGSEPIAAVGFVGDRIGLVSCQMTVEVV